MNLSFKAFLPSDYNKILPFFSLRPTLTCESHFLYHLIWREFYNSKYCILDHGVLWLQTIADKNSALLPTCRKEDLKNYFLLLQDYFTNHLKEKLKIYLVDEEALEILKLDPLKYSIVEDRDSFDYIYDGTSLRELRGRKYHKKKNHINGFLRNYESRYEYKTLSHLNSDEICSFISDWAKDKNSDDPYKRIESEERAIKDILDHYPHLQAKMAGIYIDNHLEAFTIGSYDPQLKMALIHIEKANGSIRGKNLITVSP